MAVAAQYLHHCQILLLWKRTVTKLFVNCPNTIKGNYEGKLDTASAAYMSANGNVDLVGEDEADVINKVHNY